MIPTSTLLLPKTLAGRVNLQREQQMEEEGRTITSTHTHTHTLSEIPSSGSITHSGAPNARAGWGSRALRAPAVQRGGAERGAGRGRERAEHRRGSAPALPLPSPLPCPALPAPCPARPPHRALPAPNTRSLCMPGDVSAAVPGSNRVRRARADSGCRQRDAAPPLQRGTRGRTERLPAFSRPGPAPLPSARGSRPFPAQILRRPRARPRRWQSGFGVRRGLTRK